MPRLLIAATIRRTLREFLLPFARHYRSQGWRVDALAAPDESIQLPRDSFDVVHSVPWSRSPAAPGNLRATPRAIRELVIREKYDLVHVHTPVAAFVTRFALRNLPAEVRPVVIYTAHGFHFHPRGSALKNAAFVALEKLAGAWSDFLVVLNREDAAAARRFRLVPEQRLREMPGIGVEMDRYGPSSVSAADRERIRRELGLGADGRFFLMVAEFNPGKRHRDLLRAFAAVARRSEWRGVRLVLAGQGRLLEQARSEAAQLGIAAVTDFLGQRPDVPALMSEATAVILPSEREGLPRCVLEAMCMSVPVIGTRIRGSTQLLEDGAGLLVDVGDVQGLSAAMEKVLADPAAARAVGRAGLERVSQYATPKVIALHDRLYEEALRELASRRGMLD